MGLWGRGLDECLRHRPALWLCQRSHGRWIDKKDSPTRYVDTSLVQTLDSPLKNLT